MSKKIAAITIAILILLIGGGVFLFYWFTKGGGAGEPLPGDEGSVIFPRGEGSPPGQTGAGDGETAKGTQAADRQAPAQRLRQLTTTPVAGGVLFARGNELLARWADRGTGHIYEMNLLTPRAARITNTTIPKIYEALWRTDGRGVILRYLKNGSEIIESFAANLPATGTAAALEIEGSFLPAGVRSMAVAPTTNRIFYLSEGDGGARGFIQEWGGSRRTEIFASPLREWLASWQREGVVDVASRPSAGVPGHLYLVDARNGVSTRALGNVPGLTTLSSPGGNYILHAEAGETLVLRVYDAAKRESSDLTVATLPEKCVWGRRDPSVAFCAVPRTLPSGEYPDSWYRGEVSFDDGVWKIDADSGISDRIIDLSAEAREGIDAINLSLSPNDDTLLFMNKKDLTLWSLRLQ